MRSLSRLSGLPLAVLLVTVAACSSGGRGGELQSTGGSAVGGTPSSGAGGAGGGGSGGGTVVSSGTGGAAGTGGSGGTSATGGSALPPGSGGMSAGGSSGTGSGGSGIGGSGTAVGGTTGTGGTSGRGGSGGVATGGSGSGAVGTGGAATGGVRTGGTTGTGGGTTGRGGSGGVVTGGGGGTSGGGGSTAACGGGSAPNPFGCSFAWGVNGGNPSTFNYVQFISNWAGYEIAANGTMSSFSNASWLKTMSSATQVPAYYAYIIGYYGHVNGLPDGNQGGPPNLTTGMGALLLGTANAACPQGTMCANNLIVKAYAYYATQTYAAYKKPVLWLLEGDFVQYSPEGAQTQPLSYAQLGQLAAQITLAIKCNDPPAVVAINYSSWISTTQRDSYFGGINDAMAAAGTSYEMVWMSGKGDSANAGTGTTWAALKAAAGGKPILVDESFGASAASDSWANQTAATVNARIAGGVVAANITTATPSYLQTNLTSTLAPSALSSTCF
jgi:hypothetical protein